MPEVKDYLGARTVEPGDKVDHGVKGMKWGIRRSPAQLKSAGAKRDGGESSISTKPSGAETSAQRYNRLKGQAAQKGANSLSDEDLKFVNARTDALTKVAKLNQRKPGWLKETVKKVAQDTAKNSMAAVAAALAQKHVTGPITEKITDAQKKALEDAIEKGIEQGLKNAAKS